MRANRSAGTAAIELHVTNTTSSGVVANTSSNGTQPHAGASSPLADRNVDAVLLTTNLTDIKMRESNEQQLAMDGLFSQHGEVFAKVTNRAAGDIYVDVPQTAYHAAYPSQHLVCIPYCHPQARTGKVYSSVADLHIKVPKGGASPTWVEIGSRMDTFNDGTWTFAASNLAASYACVGGQCVRKFGGNFTRYNCAGECKAPIPAPPKPALFTPAFTIEFGVKAKGGAAIVPIGSFESTVAVPGRWGECALECVRQLPDDGAQAAAGQR